MYNVNGYCEIHGKYTAPADDASCPMCDAADDENMNQYDSEKAGRDGTRAQEVTWQTPD